MNALRIPSRPALAAVVRRPFHSSCVCASGHNKWSKIKGTKEAQDLAKARAYSQASRDIDIAVRTGGGVDLERNLPLAALLKRLKVQGIPKDNIDAALERAVGGGQKGEQLLVYEALAPGNVALIIECQTSSPNHANNKVRTALHQGDARVAPVGYLFRRVGKVRVALEKDESDSKRLDSLIERMLDAGAEDFSESTSDGGDAEITFTCPPPELSRLTQATAESGLCKELISSELVYAPNEKSSELDEEQAINLEGLVSRLEDCADVLKVWTSLDE